jgi:hypothetical protein
MAARLPQLSQSITRSVATKSTTFSAVRAFHQSSRVSKSFFTPVTTTSLLSRNVAGRFANPARSYMQQTAAPQVQESGSVLRKLLVGGAIFGGTLVAINIVFNRETREDGGMPVYEREYLNNTFLHTGLGIGIIGLTARQMVMNGFVYRLMATNPWVVGIGGLALSFATMLGTRAIDPDK